MRGPVMAAGPATRSVGARRHALRIACAVALLAGLLASLPATLLPASLVASATAIPSGATVDVVIDELAPLSPKPTSTLRISGRIANASASSLTDLRVRLRVATAPVGSRDAITVIADGPLRSDDAVIVGGDGVALDSTSTAVVDSLTPGSEAMFGISVPMTSLQLRAPGAYAIAVEVLGRSSASSASERQGIGRTFLPWFPTAPANPIEVAWLWPLVASPDRTATGAFLSETIPESLGDEGRLGRLVALGDGAPVSWIADPALLQAAAAIGDGYQVDRDGTLAVGDAGANGPAWLAALAEAAGSGLRVLPYADIDATASRRAGLGTDVTRAITLSPDVAAATLPPPATPANAEPIAWMPAIDRQTSNLLVTSGVRSVVLRAGSLEPEAPTGTTAAPAAALGTLGTIAGPLTAVLADDALSDLVGLPTRTNAEALLVRQQVLAHLALLAAQASANDTPARVVIAPPVTWDPAERLVAPLLRATRTAPWLAPIDLARLLDGTSTPRQRLPYASEAKRLEVRSDHLAGVAREQDRLAALAAILDDPTPVVAPFGVALLRAQSITWRTDPDVAASLLDSIRRELEVRTDAVHVLSRGSIVFSGDVGAVPVTIENDLDTPVTVGVQLIGEPAARLSSQPLQGIRIEAGQRVSVDLDARVIGGDPLTTRVQLLTPEGDRYGVPSRVTLSSTAYARAASWVVIAAFIAIGVFVVVGITRRVRGAGRRRPASRTDDGPGSGTLPT